MMALTPSARIAGSVSGGCVETSVVEEGRQALQTGDSKLLRYGVSDETAWEVGLSCGGTIEVFVEPLTDETYAPLRRALKEKRGIARAIVVEGEQIGRSAFIEQGVGAPHDELSEGRSERSRSRTTGASDRWRARRFSLTLSFSAAFDRRGRRSYR